MRNSAITGKIEGASWPSSRNPQTALRAGRSLGILPLAVIVLLSAGLGVAIYGEVLPGGALAGVLAAPKELLAGFGLLMLLTVGYLVSKDWSASRGQRRMLQQLLGDQTAAHWLRLNPITDMHHPEVCRDLLLLQASHAARLHAPVSAVELHISNLEKLSQGANGSLLPELIRELRTLGRPTDSLLRWSPDSFLLVFPELSAEELYAARERMRREMEQWLTERLEGPSQPDIRWRSFTAEHLGSQEDILLEAERLLEQQARPISRKPEPASADARQEKGIALAIPLEIKGLDRGGKPFQEKIVTDRVAADRFWFLWAKDVPEQTPLTVIGAGRGLEETAVLAHWTPRGTERIAELRFTCVPERWVLRAGA